MGVVIMVAADIIAVLVFIFPITMLDGRVDFLGDCFAGQTAGNAADDRTNNGADRSADRAGCGSRGRTADRMPAPLPTGWEPCSPVIGSALVSRSTYSLSVFVVLVVGVAMIEFSRC